MRDFLVKEFYKIFGYDPNNHRLFFAPGRVNLIGEHTDYTGGLVFPVSIDCGTYILATPNDTDVINISSLNFSGEIVSIATNTKQVKHNNSDYFRGCLKELQNLHTIGVGFDALVYGNIPDSSGLSSSASFELVSLITILGMNGINIPKNGSDGMVKLAVLAKNCENNFVGVNCGIMDQFIIANGKKDSALLLDCFDLTFSYVELYLNKYTILVANTNKKRGLLDSKYNERRRECEEGFDILKKNGVGKEALGRVTLKEWDNLKELLNDKPTIQKRLNHVVTENDRVKRAKEYLTSNNVPNFAKLLNESGDSLKNDFEVTGEHLDAMVEAARESRGVVASRMTGAGFGGCTVNIVESHKLKTIIDNISQRYFDKTQIKGDFYTFGIGDGAKEVI